MQKIVSTSLAILLLCTGCTSSPLALPRKNDKMPEIVQIRVGKWPLYKIKKGNRVGYILGTIHVGTNEMYPFPSKIQTLLQTSSALITEVAEDEMPSTNDIQNILRSDFPLKDDLLLTSDLQDILDEQITAYQLPKDIVYNSPAWYLPYIFTSQSYKLLGLDSNYGVDVQLQKLASIYNLPNVGLEDPAQQFAIMQATTKETSLDAMIHHIPTINEATSILHFTFDFYQKDSCVVTDKHLSGIPDGLNIDRNINWLKQINNYMETEEQPFFAFGFLHLCGDVGLISLLESEGYKVMKVAT